MYMNMRFENITSGLPPFLRDAEGSREADAPTDTQFRETRTK
jgi:hypothetical protein